MSDAGPITSEKQANHLRGNALMDLRRYKEAIEYFSKAFGISAENDAHLYTNISICYDGIDDAKAESAARSAIQTNPAFSRAWYALAAVLWRTKKIDAAMDAINQSLALNPKSDESLLVKISLLCEKKLYSDALTEVERGLALYPEHADFLLSAARVRLMREEYPLAKDALNRASRIAPISSECFLVKGCYFELIGDPDNACQMYREALRLDPENTRAEKQLRTIFKRRRIEVVEWIAIGIVVCIVWAVSNYLKDDSLPWGWIGFAIPLFMYLCFRTMRYQGTSLGDFLYRRFRLRIPNAEPPKEFP